MLSGISVSQVGRHTGKISMAIMNLNTLGLLTYKMINRDQINDSHHKQYSISTYFLKFKMLGCR